MAPAGRQGEASAGEMPLQPDDMTFIVRMGQ